MENVVCDAMIDELIKYCQYRFRLKDSLAYVFWITMFYSCFTHKHMTKLIEAARRRRRRLIADQGRFSITATMEDEHDRRLDRLRELGRARKKLFRPIDDLTELQGSLLDKIIDRYERGRTIQEESFKSPLTTGWLRVCFHTAVAVLRNTPHGMPLDPMVTFVVDRLGSIAIVEDGKEILTRNSTLKIPPIFT